MRVCIQLVIFDYNQNVERFQVQIKDGLFKYKIVCFKGIVGWVVKLKYEDKLYKFLDDLMVILVVFKRGDIEVLFFFFKLVVRIIVLSIRLFKEELLVKYRFCFKKNNQIVDSNLYFLLNNCNFLYL